MRLPNGMSRNYSFRFIYLYLRRLSMAHRDFPLHEASGMCRILRDTITYHNFLDAANAGGCDMKQELIPAQVANEHGQDGAI